MRTLRVSTTGLTVKDVKGVGLAELVGVAGGMVGKTPWAAAASGVAEGMAVGVDFAQPETSRIIRIKIKDFFSIGSPFGRKDRHYVFLFYIQFVFKLAESLQICRFFLM